MSILSAGGPSWGLSPGGCSVNLTKCSARRTCCSAGTVKHARPGRRELCAVLAFKDPNFEVTQEGTKRKRRQLWTGRPRQVVRAQEQREDEKFPTHFLGSGRYQRFSNLHLLEDLLEEQRNALQAAWVKPVQATPSIPHASSTSSSTEASREGAAPDIDVATPHGSPAPYQARSTREAFRQLHTALESTSKTTLSSALQRQRAELTKLRARMSAVVSDVQLISRFPAACAHAVEQQLRSLLGMPQAPVQQHQLRQLQAKPIPVAPQLQHNTVYLSALEVRILFDSWDHFASWDQKTPMFVMLCIVTDGIQQPGAWICRLKKLETHKNVFALSGLPNGRASISLSSSHQEHTSRDTLPAKALHKSPEQLYIPCGTASNNAAASAATAQGSTEALERSVHADGGARDGIAGLYFLGWKRGEGGRLVMVTCTRPAPPLPPGQLAWQQRQLVRRLSTQDISVAHSRCPATDGLKVLPLAYASVAAATRLHARIATAAPGTRSESSAPQMAVAAIQSSQHKQAYRSYSLLGQNVPRASAGSAGLQPSKQAGASKAPSSATGTARSDKTFRQPSTRARQKPAQASIPNSKGSPAFIIGMKAVGKGATAKSSSVNTSARKIPLHNKAALQSHQPLTREEYHALEFAGIPESLVSSMLAASAGHSPLQHELRRRMHAARAQAFCEAMGAELRLPVFPFMFRPAALARVARSRRSLDILKDRMRSLVERLGLSIAVRLLLMVPNLLFFTQEQLQHRLNALSGLIGSGAGAGAPQELPPMIMRFPAILHLSPRHMVMRFKELMNLTNRPPEYVAEMLRCMPSLLGYSHTKLRYKWIIINNCAAQIIGQWGVELRDMRPASLGRMLVTSPPVLMRMDFYASKARYNGSAGKPVPAMLSIVTQPKEAWERQQPKFRAWIEEQLQPYYGLGAIGVATCGYRQYSLPHSGGSGAPLQ